MAWLRTKKRCLWASKPSRVTETALDLMFKFVIKYIQLQTNLWYRQSAILQESNPGWMQWITGTPDIHESLHHTRRYQTDFGVQIKHNVLSHSPQGSLWHMAETGCKLKHRKNQVQHHIASNLYKHCLWLYTQSTPPCKIVTQPHWIAFRFAADLSGPDNYASGIICSLLGWLRYNAKVLGFEDNDMQLHL